MAVSFGSTIIASTAGKTNPGDWTVRTSTNSTFGADGETWIGGGRSSRSLEVPVWIYGGFGTRQQLLTYLETINQLENQAGTMTNDSSTYDNCRFITLRETHRIHYSGQHSSWMFRGVAVFVQARP